MAQCTQYGALARNMRNAPPNANYIGFTGTPHHTKGEPICRRSRSASTGTNSHPALEPKAQPLQDLLNYMIYRMVGLTADEIAGLEGRLVKML